MTGGRSERARWRDAKNNRTGQNRQSKIRVYSGVRHETQGKDKETEEVLNNARVVAKIQKPDVSSDSSCGSV